MRIRYSISLWNFTHYTHFPNLERIIPPIREQGFGIELWGRHYDELDLYDAAGRKRLKPLVEGMTVSLHTAGGNGMELHHKQVDAAADLGAEVIVLHAPGVCRPGTSEFDPELAAEAVEYATQAGVKLALENGTLELCSEAIEKTPGLGVCIDTGHIYNRGESMADYLGALKGRLIHLHLQDVLGDAEQGLPLTGQDHYLPGTGGTPHDDWRLIGATLEEIDFDGIAVFEIRPRTPFQTGVLAKNFMEGIWAG